MCPMKKTPNPTFARLTDAVSLGTVARKVGIPRREVRRLIQRGKLPFVQVRGQIRVPRTAMKSLLHNS